MSRHTIKEKSENRSLCDPFLGCPSKYTSLSLTICNIPENCEIKNATLKVKWKESAKGSYCKFNGNYLCDLYVGDWYAEKGLVIGYRGVAYGGVFTFDVKDKVNPGYNTVEFDQVRNIYFELYLETNPTHIESWDE